MYLLFWIDARRVSRTCHQKQSRVILPRKFRGLESSFRSHKEIPPLHHRHLVNSTGSSGFPMSLRVSMNGATLEFEFGLSNGFDISARLIKKYLPFSSSLIVILVSVDVIGCRCSVHWVWRPCESRQTLYSLDFRLYLIWHEIKLLSLSNRHTVFRPGRRRCFSAPTKDNRIIILLRWCVRTVCVKYIGNADFRPHAEQTSLHRSKQNFLHLMISLRSHDTPSFSFQSFLFPCFTFRRLQHARSPIRTLKCAKAVALKIWRAGLLRLKH